jgi:hypothetical protein
MQHGLGYEGIDVVKLGVMMAFLSVLLIYVIYGIQVGKDIGNETYNVMSDAEIEADNANLRELSYDYVIMPAASVYSLTQYNASQIHDLTCYICDIAHGKYELMSDTPCILEHLQGKVKLKTEYDEMLGQYHLFIYPYSYTIKFDPGGGSGNMAGEEFIYDYENDGSIEKQTLNPNSFYRQGYRFAGWSLTKGGGVTFLDGQEVKNQLLFGELTLYAVWTP